MLPMAVMGAGFQRCFDMTTSLAVGSAKYVNLDEVDNGLHHSLLDSVWRWIANMSKQTGAQVNLTTHSEECVISAARVFQGLADNDFRIIRVDRGAQESRVSVYDANLAAVAIDEGVELRG
jgi:predicted ATPase